MKVELTADKVTIRGPRIDGTYVVSFEIGEYGKQEVAELVMFPNDEVVKVTVERTEDSD